MESPCINACALDAGLDRCVGCGRTRDEIGRWSQMTDAERRRIMRELPARRGRVANSRLEPTR